MRVSECISNKYDMLGTKRKVIASKTHMPTVTIISATFARPDSLRVSATYRIAQTSRGLLGEDGTGGDGATEKLGDVGEGGATVRRAGIEGGSRIGTQEGGRRQNGSGEDEAGHGWGWFSVMHYNLQANEADCDG